MDASLALNVDKLLAFMVQSKVPGYTPDSKVRRRARAACAHAACSSK